MHDSKRSWHQLSLLEPGDFALFVTWTFLSSTGSTMVPVAHAFALLQRGAGAGRVSAVLATETLPRVLLMLPGGVLAERATPRRIMIATDLLRATAQAALALLLLGAKTSFEALLVLVAPVGIGTALDSPSRTPRHVQAEMVVRKQPSQVPRIDWFEPDKTLSTALPVRFAS